ncbi:hypothetical protein HELRODRAFT_179307 [Helobdella robusta]|uniref:Uncharacterized protein n=1 Tax=Helobdella robusta TaxID=6412 RepID=T1FEI7_HELRO|nr:hypothetical protein HELRODRAFT_179307 [Helobdella robusta]ESN95532.1 hypothetical protein HELRODRAFT_179307 [Helobdella robusta]
MAAFFSNESNNKDIRPYLRQSLIGDSDFIITLGKSLKDVDWERGKILTNNMTTLVCLAALLLAMNCASSLEKENVHLVRSRANIDPSVALALQKGLKQLDKYIEKMAIYSVFNNQRRSYVKFTL